MKKGETEEQKVPFPCIVKSCCGGSSVGVCIARSEEEYEAAKAEAFRYDVEVAGDGLTPAGIAWKDAPAPHLSWGTLDMELPLSCMFVHKRRPPPWYLCAILPDRKSVV